MTNLYLQLLNADGTFNVSAIVRLAVNRARAERNLSICSRAGIEASHHQLRLGEVEAWRAEQVASLKFPPFVGSWHETFMGPALRRAWDYARAMRADWKPVAIPATELRKAA